MKNFRHFFLIAIIAFSGASNAQAPERPFAYLRGSDLLDFCGTTKDDPLYSGKNSMCLFYIGGVIDGFGAAQALSPFSMPFCVPSGVSLGQLGEVVTKYLNENESKRRLVASGSVTIALRKSYPCAD